MARRVVESKLIDGKKLKNKIVVKRVIHKNTVGPSSYLYGVLRNSTLAAKRVNFFDGGPKSKNKNTRWATVTFVYNILLTSFIVID